METSRNDVKCDEISSVLDGYSIEDQIEIIANYFVRLGLGATAQITGQELPDGLTIENVVDFLIQDVKQNGENIGNALARQGVIMLTWLK